MNTLEHSNSRIEIYLGVIRNLLDDLKNEIYMREFPVGMYPDIDRDFSRDYDYIQRRVKHEGLEFLTVALPKLGKWYDMVLAQKGCPIIDGFKPYDETGTHPAFLRWYWFVIHEHSLAPFARAAIVRLFRTLLYLFYKLEIPPSEEALERALLKWKRNEQFLQEFDYPEYYSKVLVRLRDKIAFVIRESDQPFRCNNPKHGPGAVAERESSDEKWNNHVYIRSLHTVYPRYDIFRLAGRISPQMIPHIQAFFPKKEVDTIATSRLLFVPKDSRGPRTISCEPKELMFVQQGVCGSLMDIIHRRTGGQVNFLDQTVNAKLALASSRLGCYATVDMEDASDRVSWLLVKLLFPEWALKYLAATRSERTLLPTGEIFQHVKYAPMGSALCFPIESLIFWAIAQVACEDAVVDNPHGAFSLASDRSAIDEVRVYGDDVVMPSLAVPQFAELCSLLALKVNIDKTFTSGPFRESCGTDAYDGHVVTPIKIKKDIGRRSLNGPLAQSICEYASAFFAIDCRNVGEYLWNLVCRSYPGIPRVTHGGLGILHVIDPLSYDQPIGCRSGWDPRACTIWIEGWVLTVPKEPTNLDGLPRLYKNLFGSWAMHDPSQVVHSRRTKIRKRKVAWRAFGV